MMKKVAVGISGGVDSAVAALLLKKQGYDVTAVHLYCWPPKSEIEKDGLTREEWIKKNGCRADEDRAFALKTALELGIPFKVLDFSEEYNGRVIKYFYESYEAGRTPNPDVMCNSEIKFGLFLKWALDNGFDYIATGHYASLQGIKNSKTQEFKMMIPKDKRKDQTYFLWKLTQKELEHVLFPLGDLEKNEVRKTAEEAHLSVATRKDSQGICFVGNIPARDFLARRLKENPGKVIDIRGQEIGKHDGVWFYTIGQRGGWEIAPEVQRKVSQRHSATMTPVFYVVDKDAKNNILTVAEENEAKGDQFEVGEINKISKTKWNLDDMIVRIRHGGELINARTQELNNSRPCLPAGRTQKSGLLVILDKPVRGIASGQSAVFYTKDGECLGGGIII
jgi:tRNA-uridine 2-sulfurtransferase